MIEDSITAHVERVAIALRSDQREWQNFVRYILPRGTLGIEQYFDSLLELPVKDPVVVRVLDAVYPMDALNLHELLNHLSREERF